MTTQLCTNRGMAVMMPMMIFILIPRASDYVLENISNSAFSLNITSKKHFAIKIKRI
ncbi:hypothetical protein BJV85_003485 [Clostridium acetobutylicum]|nr:Conserved hypothetical protein [Clostridium acetobutylicum EA 2018]AEI31290.1 Conserved hypothetical protein [Clostridium acetobutylicum DSM 1731]MBC2392414.1 hypothetical protein [Clostridium acetobutylicum]MBC2583708.1 hypothetical protein [Clostridium acetobutylicum]NRY57818.1 hypothetical protein [Clostridium acetobutylicum]